MLHMGCRFINADMYSHNMDLSTPATLLFLEFSRTALSTCVAGLVLFVIGIMAARADLARAGGLDKILTL